VFGLSGHLNIRAAPTTGAPVVARVLAGALLRNRGCREGAGRAWCEVEPLDTAATTGWAAAEYLVPAPAGLRAGRGVFEAIGRIPCTLAGAGPAECEAGVARDADGTAVVVVYRTGGAERVLSFDGGRFVASPYMASQTWTCWAVRERFEKDEVLLDAQLTRSPLWRHSRLPRATRGAVRMRPRSVVLRPLAVEMRPVAVRLRPAAVVLRPAAVDLRLRPYFRSA